MRTAAILILVACNGKQAPPRAGTCAAMEATLRECRNTLPDSAYASFRQGCEAYRAYRPEPGHGSDNLAAVAKRKLDTCAAARTCAELTDCLNTQHCIWILHGPDDHDPNFSCL